MAPHVQIQAIAQAATASMGSVVIPVVQEHAQHVHRQRRVDRTEPVVIFLLARTRMVSVALARIAMAAAPVWPPAHRIAAVRCAVMTAAVGAVGAARRVPYVTVAAPVSHLMASHA